jgi:hypothetical protein
VLNALAILALSSSEVNNPGFLKENLYEMYFSHTVSYMTSDDILRYVGVF